ncbi:MAG: hypothetical protein HKP10_04495 [Kiritimatiellales bacterium]|nr:hypothetical protein [Kiritimatiellales bacterium]
MKTIDHFEQNRPVHLALRDVYFERAARMISAQQSTLSPEINVGEYEEILFLLRVSREHARFSIRNAGKNETDEQFSRLINILVGNVKAALSMINLKGMVESRDGSFFSFLGANQASIALQGEEYQRRANDIIRSIHNTLKLAEDPFELLKLENSAAASEEERERYAKARAHFTTLAKEKDRRFRVAPYAKKVGRI